jgi:ACS family glucarate transporter-like MFS transporter
MRWFVMGLLFVLSFLTIVVRVCISAAKNEMAKELGTTDMTFGVVFGAFALGYAIFMLPCGWLADRWGPRKFLTLIVLLWSVFTAWTGLVYGSAMLIAVRFLFGVAEAGAFPTATRALYNWVPIRERGLALGLLNTGSRLGAALGLAVIPLSVANFGWRFSFVLLGIIGVLWSAFWVGWFRDDPRAKTGVAESELAHIDEDRPISSPQEGVTNWAAFLTSRNAYLILFQYFASNFTLFICFSWLLPYMISKYGLNASQAGMYASVPLYCGAVATWISGLAVDYIYKKGYWKVSRALPAAFGFALASVAVVAAGSMPSAQSFVVCFSLATFGVDLTLSPSWTVCCDVGGNHSGTLSAAMNMMGSFGSLASSILFPFLLALTGNVKSYFWMAALLNLLAIACWKCIQPEKSLA